MVKILPLRYPLTAGALDTDRDSAFFLKHCMIENFEVWSFAINESLPQNGRMCYVVSDIQGHI